MKQLALPLSRFQVPGVLATHLRGARLDLAIIVGLTLLAAVPRLVLLEDIPPGLHGDEAWTGINAKRILDEGSIGPYVTSALGYPSGPLYFAAVIIKIFGETFFAVRLSMALLAIVTIPVAYLTFRIMFDRTLATFAAIFLALSVWHLHFSRTAFPLISWPLLVLLTLLFLFLGIKTGRWLFYGLAGLALGAGIYTYNAHPVFAVPLALFIAWMALRHFLGWWSGRERREDLFRFAGQITLMAALAVFAALPMIFYAIDPNHDYLGRHSGISLFETERWESGGLLDRADVLVDATGDFLTAAFWDGAPDGADGAGHQAMVDRVSLVLIVAGMGIFLWRWRQPARVAVLAMVALLPFATIVTTNGTFRQSIGIVPFLAVLAAAPMALWWERSKTLPLPWRNASYAGIAVIVALVGYLNLNFYFGEYRDTGIAQFVFGPSLTKASLYVRDLPGDPYVYFYSGRWSYFYETRRYLAADVPGEDRSEQFGTFDLTPDQDRDVVYVFLAPYHDQADEVERLYPGGTRFDSLDDDGRVYFRSYFLPSEQIPGERPPAPGPTSTPGPSPTAAPAQATAIQEAAAGGEARDVTRVTDLAALEQALEQYRREHGSYPDTGGNIQTLCVFPEFDAGCDLEEMLSPLPQDPLGDPVNEGYFYGSTGSRYGIYSVRESELFPECPEHPAHLAVLDSLLCAQGP